MQNIGFKFMAQYILFASLAHVFFFTFPHQSTEQALLLFSRLYKDPYPWKKHIQTLKHTITYLQNNFRPNSFTFN